MFGIDIFDVGDPMTVGFVESELIDDIRSLASHSRCGTVSTSDVYDLLDSYHVSYDMLPNYVKDEIDNIDVY